MKAVFLLCAAFAILGCTAWQPYQNAIPNGYKVTRNGVRWNGVGHVTAGGGTAANPFGVAFYQAGHKWTQALCEADSDGDGFSNGVELGDPDCLWVAGGSVQPARIQDITHPGFNDSYPTTVAKSSTCPAKPSAETLFGNASVKCSAAVTCLTNFCACLGRSTNSGNFTCGALLSGEPATNCSRAARCIGIKARCLNKAADATGCTGLAALKMSNLAVAGGAQLYNQSAAFRSCKAEACAELNETAGTCSVDYNQLCKSPVRFIGVLRLRGQWASILADTAKKARLIAGLEGDLFRILRFTSRVLRVFTRTTRRRATDGDLNVEFEIDGVSATNTVLTGSLATVQSATGALFAETLAEYQATNGVGSSFSVTGVAAGSGSSAVFPASASAATSTPTTSGGATPRPSANSGSSELTESPQSSSGAGLLSLAPALALGLVTACLVLM